MNELRSSAATSQLRYTTFFRLNDALTDPLSIMLLQAVQQDRLYTKLSREFFQMQQHGDLSASDRFLVWAIVMRGVEPRSIINCVLSVTSRSPWLRLRRYCQRMSMCFRSTAQVRAGRVEKLRRGLVRQLLQFKAGAWYSVDAFAKETGALLHPDDVEQLLIACEEVLKQDGMP